MVSELAKAATEMKRAFFGFGLSLGRLSKSINMASLMIVSKGDPVGYIVNHPGAFGFTIYPGEAWRYRSNTDWMELSVDPEYKTERQSAGVG